MAPADGVTTEPLHKHLWPPQEEGDGAAPDPQSFDWRHLNMLAPDRSLPSPVTLAWQRPSVGFGPLTYSVTVARSQDLAEQPCTVGVNRNSLDLWHLHLGVRYYWKVQARRFGRPVAESPVWTFVTNSRPPRWIRIPGITNVRDIGGWPLPGKRSIRQGLIYRSSEMNGSLQVTPRGKRILQQDLGIRTDLDLRGKHESSPALDEEQVTWINVPISPYDSIGDDAFKEGYRRIFEILADETCYPLVFHCVGGADRGGTVAFLLNALLGKTPELLFRDYELTSLSIWGERSRLSEPFKALLDVLAAFGDRDDINVQVQAYLLSIGVTPEIIGKLRRNLVTEAPR